MARDGGYLLSLIDNACSFKNLAYLFSLASHKISRQLLTTSCGYYG